MIVVDSRVGSAEFAPRLRAASDCEVVVQELPAGDFSFAGRLESNLIGVGIERKTLGDLIASMHSGRLTNKQAPRMADHYDIRVLILEGAFRTNPETGLLEEAARGGWVPPRSSRGWRRIRGEDIDHYLMSLTWLGGINVWRCFSERHTTSMILSLYSWFNKPGEHKSFHQFHFAPPTNALMFIPEEADTDEWRRHVLRLVAKELPGIGWERSQMVMERFGTVREAVMAPAIDWRIKGEQGAPGIGPGTVRRVQMALGGRDEDNL